MIKLCKNKKSELELNTVIYVIIGLLILLLLVGLYVGIKNSGFGIFSEMEDVLK